MSQPSQPLMARDGAVVAVDGLSGSGQGDHAQHALRAPETVDQIAREANGMGRLICLMADDQHELVDRHLQDTLPDVLTAAADHFHAAQANVLLDRATMAHLHMQESCCRELLILLLC